MKRERKTGGKIDQMAIVCPQMCSEECSESGSDSNSDSDLDWRPRPRVHFGFAFPCNLAFLIIIFRHYLMGSVPGDDHLNF